MPKVIGAQNYAFQQVVTLDVSSVPANSEQTESFTVNGLRVDGGPVVVNKLTNDAGLLFSGDARVSADDTLSLKFYNHTGSAINPASQDFLVVQL